MAWNASGTFNRIVTTVSPAVGGTTIDVADQNTYTTDVTAGINACLAKNGENAATGDIDLGSNQLKAVADGTLVTDAPNVGQVQDGSFVYQGTVTGTADAIEMTVTPTLTAYAEGQVFRFKADDTCTGGGVTLDVDGLGPVDVVTNSIADPRAGDISLNGIYTVVHNGGSRFLLQNPERETDGVFVNNANGNPNISDTAIAIDSVVAADQWESVGPTSPGTADNIWTALDSVPDDADWIEVKIRMQLDGTLTTLVGTVYGRSGDGAEGIGFDNMLAQISQSDGDTDAKSTGVVTTTKIQINSDNEFDLYWTVVTTNEEIDCYLIGYGWN